MDSISITDLKKYYGAVKAVDGITFAVKQGEVFGMLGPNGAGKTTTVETIIGLTKRDSGVIQVLGLDPAQDPLGVKSRIGVQLQTAAMFPRLTVKEIVQLYANFYPHSQGIMETIALVDLTDKANVQTILIIILGYFAFGVTVTGNIVLVMAMVILGAVVFISMGYFLVNFTKTEESA